MVPLTNHEQTITSNHLCFTSLPTLDFLKMFVRDKLISLIL